MIKITKDELKTMKPTKLQLLNYFVQIFFFRVAKTNEEGKFLFYTILYPIVPFTGWKKDYIIIGGKMKNKYVLR